MVYVCDSIMGSGKSMGAITFMNEHPDQRFVYITPYLAEAARIKNACPRLRFIEPSQKIMKFGWKKQTHTIALMEEGANISTTHQAFKGYTSETIEKIRSHEYVAIIDEAVDMLEKIDLHPDDVQMAIDAGYILENNGIYTLNESIDYHGEFMSNLFYKLGSREMVRVADEDGKGFFYWMLSPELLRAFKDVYILTYLFDSQSLHHMLKIYNIPYKLIGINKDNDGTYRFVDYPGYTPDYVYHMKDKIHIVNHRKLNQIGEDYYALSMNWFKSGRGDIATLKKNLYNLYRHIFSFIPSDKRMYGTFDEAEKKIKGKGYSKNYVVFNARATNDYRGCIGLSYESNVFMNTAEKRFYIAHGIKVNEDLYALSILVQWIWRSAIRDGDDIYIYIPSRRMREILQKWIATFADGSGGPKPEIPEWQECGDDVA